MFVYCERGARVESPVALVCFSLMTLSASSRLPYIPGMSLLKTLREICTSSTFLTWIFGLGSFFQDQKFSNGLAVVRRPMDKFHVEGCARSVFFMRDACAICTVRARSVLFVRDFYSCAICARFVSFVRDIDYSCAIFIIRARSVRDSCIIRARAVHLYALLARTMFL